MRVLPDATTLRAVAGGDVRLGLAVTNDGPLIDGFSARVVGLDPAQVRTVPALLPLFPAGSGDLDLRVDVPVTFPAGRHPLTVEVSSSVDGVAPEHVDVDLVVEPRPRVAVTVRPAVQRVRRRSRHLVECRNDGNVVLVLALAASDPERLLRTGFSTPVLTVEPGATASALLEVRAPRRLLGGDLDRPVVVLVRDEAQEVDDSAQAVLRQRALVPRGALTALVLCVIMGLWAGAFLFGLTRVFAGDPLTKTAPPSFFVSAPVGDARLAAADTRLDALKDGTLPAGTGGGISGTVRAASTASGAGRIVVEVFRQGRDGLVPVASAASQSDGSYLLLGLLPGEYLLRYTAPGFVPLWYPTAPSDAAAVPVPVAAQRVTREADVVVTGRPASIRGRVDPGATTPRPTTRVTARSLSGPGVPRPVSVPTAPDGSFVLTGLPSPATYELSFLTDRYVPTTVVEKVAAGQGRTLPTVRLSAGDGVLTGRVVAVDPRTGVASGLGGVTVTTSQGGREVTTRTPTQGAVGTFRLAGLPTPGTYVVSWSAPGFGAVSASYDLGGGQVRTVGDVRLTSGTGTVTGTVRGSDGAPLGGVAVTVGGAAASLATTTVSGLGTYDLSGLSAPGDYVLTFSLAGHGPQTVPLPLRVGAPQQRVDVVLVRAVASVGGRVVDAAGAGVGGATVSVTDGRTVVETTSTATGDAARDGRWTVRDLAPGWWTVTVSRGTDVEQTVLVRVALPGPVCQDLRLVPAGSPSAEPPPCA